MARKQSEPADDIESMRAFIASIEAEEREAEERERKLAEARERVAEFDRARAIENSAKESAERFLKDVEEVNWTEEDRRASESFMVTVEKHERLIKLLDVAAHGDFWKNVPKECAEKVRKAAGNACSAGTISPALVLSKAVESMEVE